MGHRTQAGIAQARSAGSVVQTSSVRFERSTADDVVTKLHTTGWALVPKLLAPCACEELISIYGDDQRFRSTVIMERYGFGKGRYRYFAYPLPPIVERLREQLYPLLRPIAAGLG